MKVLIWTKDTIPSLTQEEKEMWFDTYNNDLYEDNGFDIKRMHMDDIEKLYIKFKKEYLDYLQSLATDESFKFYILFEDQYKKIVSQARLILKENMYLIEGLETHRDFMNKGIASKLIYELEKEAKKIGITRLYANVNKENIPSIKTFIGCGYRLAATDVEHQNRYKKDLE